MKRRLPQVGRHPTIQIDMQNASVTEDDTALSVSARAPVHHFKSADDLPQKASTASAAAGTMIDSLKGKGVLGIDGRSHQKAWYAARSESVATGCQAPVPIGHRAGKGGQNPNIATYFLSARRLLHTFTIG